MSRNKMVQLLKIAYAVVAFGALIASIIMFIVTYRIAYGVL